MLNRIFIPLVLLGTAVLMLSGCLYSREIAHTRRDIERHYPDARFEREIIVSLGPGTLRTLGWIAGLVPEDEGRMARAYLGEIERVKVGVYRTEYLPSLEDMDLPTLRRFERDGWEVAVKVRQDDEMVWLLYREDRREVRDLYVLVLSDEELVLARLQGHLDRLLQRAMNDHYEVRHWVDDIDLSLH